MRIFQGIYYRIIDPEKSRCFMLYGLNTYKLDSKYLLITISIPRDRGIERGAILVSADVQGTFSNTMSNVDRVRGAQPNCQGGACYDV